MAVEVFNDIAGYSVGSTVESSEITFPIAETAAAAGTNVLEFDVAGDTQRRFIVNADGSMEWGPGNAATDLFLHRDAANTLAQRNGTNAQTFNIYNTYTDGSNYERCEIAWAANVCNIGTTKAGTGSSRALSFVMGSGVRWSINTSGHLVGGADNTYDIGASGATRPRSIYWGTQALGPDGSASAPAYSFDDDAGMGWYRSSGYMVYADGGAARAAFFNGQFTLQSSGSFGWGATTPESTRDLILERDAANTLAQRNGVNAQAFNIYNTDDGAGNTEALSLVWASSTMFIQTTQAGTGVSRPIILRTKGTGTVTLGTNNANRWTVDASGNFVGGSDNAYDIGADGATRPRTGHFGTALAIGDNPASAGAVRLANNEWIAGRNAANGADVNIIRVNANDKIAFGNTRVAAGTPANFSADFYINFQDDAGNEFFVPAMNAAW